jgi:hypothetical protein
LRGLVVRDLGDRAIVVVPIERLARAGEMTGASQDGLFHALAGALRTLPNRVAVDARFAGIDVATSRNLWRSSLGIAYRAARALEQAGLPGPVEARALVGAQAGHSGLDIVIFAAGSTGAESVSP